MALKYDFCQVLNSSSPSETRAKCLLIHTVPVNSWSLSICSFLGLKEKLLRHFYLFEVFITEEFSTSEVFIMNLVGMSWVEINIHEKLRIIDIALWSPQSPGASIRSSPEYFDPREGFERLWNHNGPVGIFLQSWSRVAYRIDHHLVFNINDPPRIFSTPDTFTLLLLNSDVGTDHCKRWLDIFLLSVSGGVNTSDVWVWVKKKQTNIHKGHWQGLFYKLLQEKAIFLNDFLFLIWHLFFILRIWIH